MEETSGVVTSVLLKLDDPVVKQGISSYGVEEEAEELVAELTWIKCFLVDGGETKQGRSRVSVWAAIIQRYALKAQKVLSAFDHSVDVEIGGEQQSLSVETVAHEKLEIENIINKLASLREKLQIYVTFGVTHDDEETSNLSKAQEAKHRVDPPREIKVTKWGGRGGGEWSYRPKAPIKLVVVGHGKIIDSISFMSRDEEFSERHGGRGGSTSQVRINSPMEYLTGISGTFGGYGNHVVIRSLKFHTNMKEHGPMGTQDGTPFSFVMQEGVIVGFYGRAGYYLDAIGVYATPKYDVVHEN